MKENFLLYPEALELKLLGFNEPCLAQYVTYGSYPLLPISNNGVDWNYKTEYLPAPLYQQAFKWFRQQNQLTYEINQIGGLDFPNMWNCLIHRDEGRPIRLDDRMTYEEAELFCIREMIVLAKSKQHPYDRRKLSEG